MKRFTYSVVFTAVLGLAAMSVAAAQAAGQQEGLKGAAAEGRRGPGFGRGMGMMPGLRGLDLTEAQREQIASIRQAEQDAWGELPAVGPLHRQLQAELFAEAPDAQKISALQVQIAQAESEHLTRRIALEQKIAQVLTADQRAQVRERLAQAPPQRGRRGPRR